MHIFIGHGAPFLGFIANYKYVFYNIFKFLATKIQEWGSEDQKL
jgi:hypothetical protein